MIYKQDGITLVEVLATLVLISLVTGIIWTAFSIAAQFNINETSSLHLQKEANYILSDLQQIHRHCHTYDLTIARDQISVTNCEDDKGQTLSNYNKIISNNYKFRLEGSPDITASYNSTKEDLELNDFIIIDPVLNKNGKEKFLRVPSTISRFKTEYAE